MPHAVHTIKHIPMLPEYFKAAVGLTKIPEPIMTLIITFTAAIRPMFRLSPPSSAFSLFFFVAPERQKVKKNY